MAILDPFTEDERYLIQHALASLSQCQFFERVAQRDALDFIARFDSMPEARKLLELEQVTGSRRTLLALGVESKRLAEELGVSDSTNTETGDSINEHEDSLDSLLGA